MSRTSTATPVGVLADRLARDLFTDRQTTDEPGTARVTLADLRALCGSAQRAMLDEIEQRITAEPTGPADPNPKD